MLRIMGLLVQVFSLPMRDGNIEPAIGSVLRWFVFSLPMRDGNMHKDGAKVVYITGF